MNTKNFAGIDVLRFAAAILVCLFHIAFMNTMAPESDAAVISGGHYSYSILHGLTSIGWVGVQVFFVISGFVILGSARGSATAFARSRILRLYPAVWICAPISLAIALTYAAYPYSEALTRIVRSMLLWPKGNWVDGVYWTLGIELVFYTVVCALLALNARRHISMACLVIGVCSATYWLLQWAVGKQAAFGPLHDVLQGNALGRYFELSLIPHGCFFAIGALLQTLLVEGGSRKLWLPVGYCSAGALVEINATAAAQSSATSYAMNGSIAQWVWVASVLLLIGSVVWVQALEPAMRVLRARKLGVVTYPLYLLHTMVGSLVLAVCSAAGLNAWMALAVALVNVVGLSLFVHKVLELPLKNKTAKFIDYALDKVKSAKFTKRVTLTIGRET
jgi:peptidoglycan/LPS O-acetylase OafA/YrhL